MQIPAELEQFAIIDERVSDPTYPLHIYKAVDDLRLKPNTLAVYFHLVRCSKNPRGCAYPSYATIGEHCFRQAYPNAKPETLRRAAIESVKELLSLGVIRKAAQKEADGGHASNAYVITRYDTWNVKPENAFKARAEARKEQRGGSAITPPPGGVVHMHPPSAIAPNVSSDLKNHLTHTHSTHARAKPAAGDDDEAHLAAAAEHWPKHWLKPEVGQTSDTIPATAQRVRQSSIPTEYDQWAPVFEKMRNSPVYGRFFSRPEEARLCNVLANRRVQPSDVLAIWDQFDIGIVPTDPPEKIRKSLINWMEREKEKASAKGSKLPVGEKNRAGNTQARGILKNGFSEGKTNAQLVAEFKAKMRERR